MAKESKLIQSDVFNAANRLRAEGFTPTVRALRKELGGSTEIISQFLKEWRSLYPEIEEGAQVDPISGLVSELYDRIIEKALAEVSVTTSLQDKMIEDTAVLLEAQQFILDEEQQKNESTIHSIRKLELLTESLKAELDSCKKQLADCESHKRAALVEVAHFKEKAEDLYWHFKQEKNKCEELESKLHGVMNTHSEQLEELTRLLKDKD